jgi:hypothetical protein
MTLSIGLGMKLFRVKENRNAAENSFFHFWGIDLNPPLPPPRRGINYRSFSLLS